MPRAFSCMQRVYIADGFADDCDELIHRCSKVDFLKYEVFTEIWKDMQLSCIYEGRISGAEVAELSEEVLQVAKHYMVVDTSNFEESVAGLFLVYALLNLQPYPGFAALRIVQTDLPAIERIASVARRDRRHDVLYILGSVLVRGPCQFHADARERGMEASIKKYLDGHVMVDQLGVRPKGVFLRQNEELDIIRELAGLEKRYSAAKLAVNGTANTSRNFDYASKDLAKELESSLKNIINGVIEHTDTSDDERPEHIESLKQAAMRSKVQPMKHLVTVNDSESTQPKSPIKKTNVTTPSGKIKTGTPKKAVATGSPKKRKLPPKPAKTRSIKKKKTRITFESDTDDEEDDTLVLLSSDEDSLPSNDTDPDIDLNQFHKPTKPEETDVKETSTHREVDIKIDSLPCLIRSEQCGKYFEIEIIDEQLSTKGQPKIEDETNKKIKNVESSSFEVALTNKQKSTKGKTKKQNKTKTKIDNVVKPSSSEDLNEMAEITKVDDGIIVSESSKSDVQETKKICKSNTVRRKKKNTILKNRLQRLGTLPVADLDTK